MKFVVLELGLEAMVSPTLYQAFETTAKPECRGHQTETTGWLQ